MNSESRLHFESELLKELNNIASRFESVVASRNKLKFGYNKNMWLRLSLITSPASIPMCSAGWYMEEKFKSAP